MTGGTEIQTLSLQKALKTAGHDVSVACYFEYSEEMVQRYKDAGAKVFLLSPTGERPEGMKKTFRHLYKGLKKIVRETHPEVVHVQYMAPGAMPIIILRLLGVRNIVATAHTPGDIYSPTGLKIIRFLNRYFLKGFQCITLRAEKSFFGTVSLYSSDLPLKKKNNHFTIYNNVPDYIERLENGERLTSKSDQSLKTPRNFTIGVISRLEPIKGMDLVIPAFSKVHPEFPNSRLLIVGEGSLRASMERQASELNLPVTFVGRQPQEKLQDFYDQIDILLMPSRSEGFGLTAVEGMTRGCVPVVADVGGLPEVVEDVKNGLLHKREDVADMAEKIKGLLAAPEELGRLSKAAIKRSEEFSTIKYNEAIADWFTRLL